MERPRLGKTHQSGDWGGTLTPEMIEYAAKDVEVLLPLYEVLKAKIEEASLTYAAEIEHRALPAVVWMSSAGVPIDADGWRVHALKAEADAARLEEELKALAPEHPDSKVWNFGSHQQVRQAAGLLQRVAMRMVRMATWTDESVLQRPTSEDRGRHRARHAQGRGGPHLRGRDLHR